MSVFPNQTYGLEIHLRNGPRVNIQGIEFEFMIIETDGFSVELRAQPTKYNFLTDTELATHGLNIKTTKEAFMDRSIQKAVIECLKFGYMPHLNGKTYSWIPNVQVEADGNVFITIKAGRMGIGFNPKTLKLPATV